MYPYHTVTGNTALCITANFPANVSVGSNCEKSGRVTGKSALPSVTDFRQRPSACLKSAQNRKSAKYHFLILVEQKRKTASQRSFRV